MSHASPGLALAWRIAASEARLTGFSKIECTHLLMGLLSLEKATPKALRELRLDPAQTGRIRAEHAAIAGLFEDAPSPPPAVRRVLRSRIRRRRAPRMDGVMSRSAAAKAAFAEAEGLAGGGPVNCLHLLTALLRAPDPDILALVKDRHLSPDLDRKSEAAAAQSFEDPKEAAPIAKAPAREKAAPEAPAAPVEDVLERFGRDLSAQAARGEIGPVFGRQKQIQAVLRILSKAARRHPLLVGEPGVGKRAVVEALAARGAAAPVAEALHGKRFVELNLRAFLSGTALRGELASRMKALIDELEGSTDVILFVDDIHALIRPEGSGPGLEAANLLKPALARGIIRIIGAATVGEFRESLERDPALERFEKVDVPEPTLEETVEILEGLRPRLEKSHGVRIMDEAVQAAVSLSVRFDPEHRLPDKAMDLLKRSAARLRGSPSADAAPPASGPGSGGAAVDARAVAEVLAEKRGLPIEALTDSAGSGARLLKLEAHLKARIFGQDEAVARVASRINLAHSALSNRESALAVFLLLGPSGVGKTELARRLAPALFGSSDHLSFFAMSDFSSADSAVRLLGSLPGAGYEPPQLFDAIRRRPDSVVVFDEVEKAHSSVIETLHQLCDTGRVTDSQGRVADASGVVVVMTSNVGSGSGPVAGSDAGETLPLNRGAQRKAGVRKLFGADFLDRIDEVITLRPLGEADVRRLARPLLARLVATIRKTHGVFLRLDREAENFVIRSGFSDERGVHDLKAVIERLVEGPVSSLAQSGGLSKHPAWKGVLEKGVLSFLPE